MKLRRLAITFPGVATELVLNSRNNRTVSARLVCPLSPFAITSSLLSSLKFKTGRPHCGRNDPPWSIRRVHRTPSLILERLRSRGMSSSGPGDSSHTRILLWTTCYCLDMPSELIVSLSGQEALLTLMALFLPFASALPEGLKLSGHGDGVRQTAAASAIRIGYRHKAETDIST